MNRPAKIVYLSCLLVPAIALGQPGANTGAARAETVIYKHIDENGRVTYANSPIKGGTRVDLEPLTVIPSTPSGSLNAANAQVVPRNTAAAATAAPVSPSPAKPAFQVASVMPLSTLSTLSSQAQAAKPATQAPENTVVASIESLNQLTQQRQAETRKRLLEGELQTEEQLLGAAKSKLAEEQKNSGSIRAMRASFSATAEGVTAQKPLISPETRAEIERHFERVRNLQDQVAMHENHLQTLRGQLDALK